MTIHTCDFCGDTLPKSGAAAQLLLAPAPDAMPLYPVFEMLSGRRHAPEQLDICAGCLAHLLPLAARIRNVRRAPAATARTVITDEIGSMVDDAHGGRLPNQGPRISGEATS